MLKFKTIEKVHANKKVLDLLSNYTYQVNEGQIRILKNTNLQFVKLATKGTSNIYLPSFEKV